MPHAGSHDGQAEPRPPLLTPRCRALPQDPTPVAPYRGPAPAPHKARGIKGPPATATAAARPRFPATAAPATRAPPRKAPPPAHPPACPPHPPPQRHTAPPPPTLQTN